jgi:uncharacterized protein
MSISRNDLCICGSGEKYKKCCMNNNVVSLDNIRDVELNRLQLELLDFATYQHEELIDDLVDEILNDEYLDDDEEEILVVYLIMWVIFTIKYDGKQTMIEQFIDLKKKGNKLRSSTMKKLESWANTAPSYSIVTKIIDDLHLEIEDVFSSERKTVKLLEKDEELEVGGSLLGLLLPYGKYDMYFTMYLDFEENETPELVSEIRQNFAEADLENETDFMRSAFPAFILAIFGVKLGESPDIEQLEWDSPKYEEVAALYSKHVEEEGPPKQFQDLGVMFWYMFCTKEKPIFHKPEIYAAALHYFSDQNIPSLDMYTKGELAEMYGVSVGSLSKAYRHLEKGLEDELDKFHEYIEQDEFDFDDVTFDDIFDDDDEDEVDWDEPFSEDKESPFNRKRK